MPQDDKTNTINCLQTTIHYRSKIHQTIKADSHFRHEKYSDISPTHLLSSPPALGLILQSVNLRRPNIRHKFEHIKSTYKQTGRQAGRQTQAPNMTIHIYINLRNLLTSTSYTFFAQLKRNNSEKTTDKAETTTISRQTPLRLSIAMPRCATKQNEQKVFRKDENNPNKTISKMPRIRT